MLALLPGGSTYTQTFDGIGTALPAGWTVRTGATATSLGTAAIFSTAATEWANVSGAFKNFASADGLVDTDTSATQGASLDRALGIRQSSSFGNPGGAFTFEIDNTTGKSSFNLSVKHQMLSVQPRSTTWTAQYSIDGGTAWTDLGTYTDPGVFGSTTGTYSFGSAIDDKATPVFIRITALTAASGSGNRDSYGIDDFSLSWTNLNPSQPELIVSGSATPFSTIEGTPSAAQTFAVTGSNLTAGITATAPTGFEVSSNGSTYGPSATFVPTAGSVAGTLSVRIAASTPWGSPSGNVTLESPGAQSATLAVAGAVRPLVVTLPYGPADLETTSQPWFTYSVAGSANWSYITSTLGLGGTTAPANKVWQMNGFGSDVPANDWLMIGPFNFTGVSNPMISFNTLNRFTATQTIVNELELKASSDFTGSGDPSSATWTAYSFAKPTLELTKTPSGFVSLADKAGQANVYVAFHYQAGGTLSGTTAVWQVDDIEVRNIVVPPLVLTVPDGITEIQTGVQGSVSIPTALATDLIVAVASGDAANLLVGTDGAYSSSTNVTIPAGQTSATFLMTAVPNASATSNVTVTLTASVGDSSHSPDTADVTVIDLPAADVTGLGYTQNFATFAAASPALPTGWSATGSTLSFPATDNSWGVGVSAGYRGGDSVFGYQHTSSTGTVQQIVTLRNATGAPLTALTVRYDGRMSRADQTRLPSYTVTVAGQSVPALAYSTGDGDAVLRVASLTGLSIPVDGLFQVVWSSDRDNANTGGSRQIGISNVSVTSGVSTFPPTVSAVSVPIVNVTRTTAAVSATVTGDGGSAVTARGFVYAATSANASPEIGGTGVTNVVDGTPAVGSYIATLTGLTAATGYTIRAYATNAQGTTYSQPLTFTTANPAASFAGNYSQSFSTYAGTLPIGWNAVSSTGVQTYGGEWNTTNSTAGFRGIGTTETAGVLGYQHTTGTGTLTASLILVNDTGAPLTELTIGYLGRVGRSTETRTPEWTVSVGGTAVPALAYSTGNTSGAGGVATDQQLSATLPVDIAAGAEFTLTWVATNGLEGQTGASRQIGIGNVQISSGIVAAPSIGTTGSLSAVSMLIGDASTVSTVAVTGSNLTADVVATAPTGFEVASDGTTFGPTATFLRSGGSVNGTLSVRLAPPTPAGSTYSGNVALASTGATAVNVAVPPSTVTDELVFDITSGQTVTYSVSRTAAVKYIKRGLGTLVLDAASSHTGQTTIEAGTLVVAAGNALSSSAVRVVTGGTLTVNSGLTMRSPTVTIAGGTLAAAGATILVNATTGIGTLSITSGSVTGSPSLTVSGNGVVTLPTDRRQVVALTALDVDQATSGRIDIGKGRIDIATGATEADLRADLIAGRNTGAFNGTSGIMTTGGKASVNSANPVVGYRVTGGSAVVAWAAYGDSNLDGVVNSTDISLVNGGGRYNAGAPATWQQGDYNYSNDVNSTDITLLNGSQLYGTASYLPITATALRSSTTTTSSGILQSMWIAYANDTSTRTTKKR